MIERNYFKEKLYNHTMPVNDGMWSAIEAQLPPEGKQKRFPVFWMTLFGTTLLGGALMIGVFNQQSKATSPPSPPVKNEVIASTLTDEISSDDTDATGASMDADEMGDEGTSSSTISFAEATADESAITSTSGINNTSIHHVTAKQNLKANQEKDNLNSSILRNQTGLFDSELESNLTNSMADDQSDFVDQDVEDESLVLPYRNTSLTSALPLADMQNNAASSLLLMPGIAPDPNCYKFGDIGAHWAMSVDMMVGPGYSFKSYEANGGETADYISARKSTESFQYAWSTGARLNLHHRNGLTARLGLNYTQVGDIFDYTDSLATQSTTRIDSFFAADGTFLYTEVTQVLIDGTLVKKIHNTYRYLDIPLLVGYEMRLGRNIVMLNAGPVFNLTHTYEGQILDSMLHPRSITPGDPGAIDIYKTNVGMSLYLSAGILFPLSDRFSALIEPSYTYRFKPVTLNSYELKENRNFFNLNLGVRYHIN